MKIEKYKVDYWPELDSIEHIAKCARVCYASMPKFEINEESFVNSLWRNGHRSVFRHSGSYYIIPIEMSRAIRGISYGMVRTEGNMVYVSTNEQVSREYMDLLFLNYKIPTEEAFNNPVFIKNKMLLYTYCIDTGIDITRELNRVSPNNICEQSTRYIDFLKKVGIRFKECWWMKHNKSLYKKLLYKFMCKVDEWFYHISRSKYGLDLAPEDARWCLFLDSMSKVVYTYTVKEWERIINLRVFGWTGCPHKDAKAVVTEILADLTNRGYHIEVYELEEHSKFLK